MGCSNQKIPQHSVLSPLEYSKQTNRQQSIHQINDHLLLHDDLRRLKETAPIAQSESFGNRLKNIILSILWFPSKLFFICKYLFWTKFPFTAIFILCCSFLYSPTKKIMQSIDFQSATKELLQSMNIIPAIKYCDTYSSSLNDECTDCPEFARCVDGNVFCKGDKRFIRGQCIYDPTEMTTLQSQMQSYSVSLLSSRCGEYECQSYALYNYLYSDTDNERILNMALSEEELSNELAKTLQLDAQSHLFQNVFEKFTNSIKEENKTIYFKDLEYAQDRGYFSNKSSKTFLCHVIIFLTQNCFVIIPVMIAVFIVSLWYFKRNRKRNRMLRRKQIA